jgi:hypothetical protein
MKAWIQYDTMIQSLSLKKIVVEYIYICLHVFYILYKNTKFNILTNLGIQFIGIKYIHIVI